jgi:hypothetical protein
MGRSRKGPCRKQKFRSPVDPLVPMSLEMLARALPVGSGQRPVPVLAAPPKAIRHASLRRSSEQYSNEQSGASSTKDIGGVSELVFPVLLHGALGAGRFAFSGW